MTDKVYILLLNWNGWKDTIECLESVFRNDYPNYQVIVCDNDSSDNSLDHIKNWANGRLPVTAATDNPLHVLSSPPVAKPIPYIELTREQTRTADTNKPSDNRLVLIQTGGNLGFAGGNNVGLRYVLSRDDFSYVWLLNNDTVIRPDALSCLVRRMRERQDAGMCGSTIPYYSEPDTIWTLGGGQYNKWRAQSHSIGNGHRLKDMPDHHEVEAAMDYLAGASMLVSRSFLRDIGLMNEDYFLYFEEPDWALRATGRYSLAYAADSIVYHKVGVSTGTFDRETAGRRSTTFHAMRSHLLFVRRFFPLFLPFVLLRICFQLYTIILTKAVSRFK